MVLFLEMGDCGGPLVLLYVDLLVYASLYLLFALALRMLSSF